jgi:hypothetical protein
MLRVAAAPLRASASAALPSAPARSLSKYVSKAKKKRMPLSPKRVGKGFYKGVGARSEGKLNSKAQFIVDPAKRLALEDIDLADFPLKAYVAVTTKKQPFPSARRFDAAVHGSR